MTGQRRFEETIISDPGSVKPLPDDHPAIIENRPLFPTMVVPAKDRDRLFVSGHNSRKIGRMIVKGAWKGMPIYTLTLPERTTCPPECHVAKVCYGNAMPFAVRRAPGAELESRILKELRALELQHPDGFVVRLHVLGDFYSQAYAYVWHTALSTIGSLHVYGYTALGQSSDEARGAIADVIDRMNIDFPDRCFIRFSDPEPIPGGATTINRVPEAANVPEGLVCPAEREATACCATCGMCWEAAARDKTIVFVLHGMGSRKSDVIARQSSRTDANGLRRVEPITRLSSLAGTVANRPPELLWVKPTELYVDESYQRTLSRRSVGLITRVLKSWDWTHVKPPIVCRDETGRLEVIDGQHTAIAAASHPEIDKIPVMLVQARSVADRARAFVGHNQDRIAVTPAQIHYSMVAARDPGAIAVDDVCRAAGVKVLKYPPSSNQFKPGDSMSIKGLQKLVQVFGAERATVVLRCMVQANRAPVRAEEAVAIARAFHDRPTIPTDRLVDLLLAIDYDVADANARILASDRGIKRGDALALIYGEMLLSKKTAKRQLAKAS